MASGDLWRSIQHSLASAGHGALAGIAGGQAMTEDARKDGRDQDRRSQEQFVKGLHTRIQTGQIKTGLEGTSLPEDFKPLDKIPSLLGQFPRHPDGHNVRDPSIALQWLAGNQPDAYPRWAQNYVMAAIGFPPAQFALAKALETGEDGTKPDPVRAFFYYYRAGMQAHADARQGAERLADQIGDFRWITDQPYLLHSGDWEIIQDKFGEAITTRHFGLADNGTLSGKIQDLGGVAGDRLKVPSDRRSRFGRSVWSTTERALEIRSSELHLDAPCPQ